MSMLSEIEQELKKLGSKEKAKTAAWFFKTGKGEYGEGDVFLGINGPKQREVAKKYIAAGLNDIQKLLNSKIHEHRQTGLFILVEKFKRADDNKKKELFDFYLGNTKNINNWDLVDCSSHKIVGNYLFGKDRKILYKLAKSSNLWEKRIAIVSTYEFIRNNDFTDTLKLAELLLTDSHDLIHKAVGWMLREVGKRDQQKEEEFLKKHCRKMPRTMLRYAIERFPEEKRKYYMRK